MYEAPIDDYKFVIDHLIGLNQLMATTGHDDISIDLVEAVLSEAGKLACLLYTSPSPRDTERSRMPSSA